MTKKNALVFTDRKQIPELLKTVQKKQEELKAVYGGNVEDLSDDYLEPFGKISEITEVSTLIKAISSIKGRQAAYKSAFKEVTIPDVSLEKYPFKIKNTSPDRWIEVINKRIGQITYEDHSKKLKEIESICEKYLSDDMKFANDMSKLQGILDLKI